MIKVSCDQYNFINKVITHLKPKEEVKIVVENKKEDNTNLHYNKEDKRIVGDTDYKKYEVLSKEIEIEEKEQSKETNTMDKDKLKMGCSNDLRKERQLYDKPTKEKIEACSLFKTEGDQFIKAKDYKKATDCYEKGLLQLFYTFEDSLEEEKEVEKLKISLNSNIALCKINNNEFKESIGYLTEVIKLDKVNVKAIYRLSYVYFKLEDFETSKNYIADGLNILNNLNDTVSINMFNQLELDIIKKEEEITAKTNSLYKKMLVTSK